MKKNYFPKLMPGIAAALVGLMPLQSQAQTTQTFSYTGSMQTFTVPACVSQVTIVAAGARGVGTTAPYLWAPGQGGWAKGVFTATPGMVLNIFVGGTNGYNGGGTGLLGANGGGASDVRVGGTAFTDRIIVAGGGGGAGGDNWQCNTGNGNGGGGTPVGSNFVGGEGGAGYTSGSGCGGNGGNNGGTGGTGTHGGGGGGGGLTSGGVGATSTYPGTAGSGSLGLGGNAFNSPNCASYGTGGGGGGYYGGGGAAGNNCGAGRGGGGSSWTGTLANPSFTAGTNNGNGLVSITFDFGLPTLTITSSTSSLVCKGTTMTLSASGGVSTYTWSNGSTGNSIVVSPTANVTYSVASQGTAVCPAYGLFPVATIGLPNITATASPNYIICPSVPVTLTGGGANTYAWSGGVTNGVPFPASATTIYTVTGTNTVTGCSNTNTVLVPVYVANVSVSSPTTICAGSSAQLSASGALSYTWSNGSQFPQTNVSPLVTTVYTVNATTSDFCTASNTTTVTVNPTPTVLVTTAKAEICKGESVVLSAAGASSYSWSSGGTTNTVSVSPNTTTTYSVIGTTNSCSSTKTISVKVNICLGISESTVGSSTRISVFPNPSTGEFTVMANEAMQLEIVNELGQSVKMVKLTSENGFSQKVNSLPHGVYFINSKDPSRNYSQKIIIGQ